MSVIYHPDLGVSQNYLKDPRLVAALIEQSSLGPDDIVYEIGPGKGIITLQLALRCRKVVAIEKDSRLFDELQSKYIHIHNLFIHNNDFLAHPLPHEPYKVFSNIPFNITSAIVARLTGAPNPPEQACLVMQKEAAEMYLGKPACSLRSILLQPWFNLQLMHRFRRSDFSPQPHVDAVLLQICKRSPPWIDPTDRRLFRDFVVYCFSCRYSTVEQTLKRLFSYTQVEYIQRKTGIKSQDTPTCLHIGQWMNLFESYKKFGNNRARMEISGSEKRLVRQQKKLKKIHRTGYK